MQMIFSGEGIGGSQAIASSAWSGEHRAASSPSFVNAPPAMASRSVGYSFPKRAERSTSPPSTTAPYFCDPSTEKVAMRRGAMRCPIVGKREVVTACVAAAASAGVHSLGLDHCGGGGSLQKGDERLGGFRLSCVCGD